MPHVVKLSSDLVAAAREAAALAHRSATAQIEYWASLGKSIDATLTTRQANELVQAVREPGGAFKATPEPLSATFVTSLSGVLSVAGGQSLGAEPSPRARDGQARKRPARRR